MRAMHDKAENPPANTVSLGDGQPADVGRCDWLSLTNQRSLFGRVAGVLEPDILQRLRARDCDPLFSSYGPQGSLLLHWAFKYHQSQARR